MAARWVRVQRLGHQHVVVHRDGRRAGCAAAAAGRRWWPARPSRCAPIRAPCARPRARTGRSPAPSRRSARGSRRRARPPPGRARAARRAGMHQCAVVLRPAARPEDRAVDLGPDRRLVEVLAVRSRPAATAPGAARRPPTACRCARTGSPGPDRRRRARWRRGSPAPSRSRVSYSSGQRLTSVLRAVGQARLGEAAVAARGRPAERLGLQQHDAGRRVAPLGQHRGPQAAVPAADDREVGLVLAVQRRLADAAGVVEPEHPVLGRRQRRP